MLIKPLARAFNVLIPYQTKISAWYTSGFDDGSYFTGICIVDLITGEITDIEAVDATSNNALHKQSYVQLKLDDTIIYSVDKNKENKDVPPYPPTSSATTSFRNS